MKYLYSITLVIAFCLVGCKDQKKESQQKPSIKTVETTPKINPAKELVNAISATHHAQDFQQEKAVRFHLSATLAGKKPLNATITLTPDFSTLKIEKEDSTTLIYNGNDIFVYPKEKVYDQARFDMFTWPYFFALPYKLNDNKPTYTNNKERSLLENTYQTAELQLKGTTNKVLNNSLVVYADNRSFLLKAIAYSDPNEKSSTPDKKAIVYENYFTVKMLPIAKNWKIYTWNEDKGIYGKPIGEGEISDIEFPTLHETTFAIPEGAVKIKK